jgi:uncharacterized protein (TIGR02391 family)
MHPPWPPAVVQAVSDVLASTDWPGLTNTEIGRLLMMLGIANVEAPNKRTRLWAALHNRQLQDRASNCIIRFITEAMAPGRYLQDGSRFEALRDGLCEAMSLVGLRVTEQGKVARAEATATTLDEVAQLAGRLRSELRRRGVHAEVLRYCGEELLRKSLFHAVFEATKGVSERLRQLSGLTADGADLVDQCFGSKSGPPLVMINRYHSDSETSEHRGFANLLKGVFGTFRNPPAHTPRATAGWTISEPDALDLFSMLSLIHRRLDAARVRSVP